jgi:hypothetical protein
MNCKTNLTLIDKLKAELTMEVVKARVDQEEKDSIEKENDIIRMMNGSNNKIRE